jgi:hypothetical protein
MNLWDILFNMLNVAGGIVIGTLLTWTISYFIGKNFVPKMIKSISKDPEVMETIKNLKKKLESESSKNESSDDASKT